MGRKRGRNGAKRRDLLRAWEHRNVVMTDGSQPPSPPTHTMEPASGDNDQLPFDPKTGLYGSLSGEEELERERKLERLASTWRPAAPNNPTVRSRPLNMATTQSKLKTKSVCDLLPPYKARPATSTAAARRLLQRALGSDKKVPAASKVEQDRLREAIRNKEEERKRKRREMKKEAEKKRETKQEEEIKRSVREEDEKNMDFVRKEEDR